MPRRRKPSGTARAERFLERHFERVASDVDWDIGRVRFLGSGLSYDAYGAAVAVDGRLEPVVVRLPRADADADLSVRTRREFDLLEHLESLDIEVRLPTPLALYETEDGVVPIQRLVEGIQLDLRARYPGFAKPWEVVAEAAAVCHSVELPDVGLPRHETRRAHGLASLEKIEALEFPAARDAVAWAREHLPPEEPSTFLHGDLLGQNLRVTDDPDEPVGIIDWEFAILGDPAYDLAIVTRGARRPFHESDSLARLLEAYNALAAVPLRVADVRLYELALVADLYRADLEDYGPGRPPVEATRRKFQSVLRRALAES